MNRPLVIGAALAVLLTSGAQARPHHHHRHQPPVQTITCDLRGCHNDHPDKIIGVDDATPVAATGGCPRSLGCGCNLANKLGGIARFGRHVWRELWVARNWQHEGTAASKGCTGCVAVLSRGRGGHVGIVKGYDANGNPIIHSYANGRLGWTTTTYSKHRVIAWREI